MHVDFNSRSIRLFTKSIIIKMEIKLEVSPFFGGMYGESKSIKIVSNGHGVFANYRKVKEINFDRGRLRLCISKYGFYEITEENISNDFSFTLDTLYDIMKMNLDGV
jgi:hypothetical protein